MARRCAIALATSLFVAASSASLTTAAGPAERATAADLAASGERAFSRGEFVAAAEAFEAAYRIEPKPGGAFNAGVAWERAKRWAEASNAYHRAVAGLEGQPQLTARARLAEIEPLVGKLGIAVGAGHVLRVDRGEPIPSGPSVLYVMPGPHAVVIEYPDGERYEGTLAIEAGHVAPLDTNALHPVVPKPKPPEHAPRAAAPQWSLPMLPAYVMWGIAGGSFAGYGVTGALGLAAKADFEDSAFRDADARDRAVTMRTTANVLFFTGVVSLVAGTVYFLASRTTSRDLPVLRAGSRP